MPIRRKRKRTDPTSDFFRIDAPLYSDPSGDEKENGGETQLDLSHKPQNRESSGSAEVEDLISSDGDAENVPANGSNTASSRGDASPRMRRSVSSNGADRPGNTETAGSSINTSQQARETRSQTKHASASSTVRGTAPEIVDLSSDDELDQRPLVTENPTGTLDTRIKAATKSSSAPAALVKAPEARTITVNLSWSYNGQKGARVVQMSSVDSFETLASSITGTSEDVLMFWEGVEIYPDYSPDSLLQETDTTLSLTVMPKNGPQHQNTQVVAPEATPLLAADVIADSESKFAITINCKDKRPLQLRVGPSTVVKNIAAYVRSQKELAESVPLRLEFDHEELSLESTVGETEIEADDALDAFY